MEVYSNIFNRENNKWHKIYSFIGEAGFIVPFPESSLKKGKISRYLTRLTLT